MNIFFRIIFVISISWANLVFADNLQTNPASITGTTANSSVDSSGSTSSQSPQTAPNVSLAPSSQDKEGISKFFEKSNFGDFEEQIEAKPFVIPGGRKYEH